MGLPDDADATRLLAAASRGDEAAAAKLLPLVYEELRDRAARMFRRERRDHTLQATALVHDAYLRLIDQKRVDWKGRTHFYAIAAETMRRILVDHARAKATAKRGRGAEQIALEEATAISSERNVDPPTRSSSCTAMKTASAG